MSWELQLATIARSGHQGNKRRLRDTAALTFFSRRSSAPLLLARRDPCAPGARPCGVALHHYLIHQNPPSTNTRSPGVRHGGPFNPSSPSIPRPRSGVWHNGTRDGSYGTRSSHFVPFHEPHPGPAADYQGSAPRRRRSTHSSTRLLFDPVHELSAVRTVAPTTNTTTHRTAPRWLRVPNPRRRGFDPWWRR